jgi:hypothetical protein
MARTLSGMTRLNTNSLHRTARALLRKALIISEP